MPTHLDRSRARRCLEVFDLKTLFIDELGWDRGGTDSEATVASRTYVLEAIAHKRGLVAYRYVADSDDTFPDYLTRQKIEKSVAKTVREHLIVYVSHGGNVQYWQWVKREPGRPDRLRQHIYHWDQPGEALIQKLEQIAFTLDEEEDLTIVNVSGRVRAAFDVEKVTKKFYERFKKEHRAFLGFIEGIENVAEREWYASLMLNRMMFIYFIQKRGFLDGDTDYLRDRLEAMRTNHGKDRFQSFYRLFLMRLFHEGLGQPVADRSPELAALLGRVPYLNGGLFDVHDLEQDNPEIQIPDAAFEQIFNFFDAYQWHLDDRPLHDDKEINPDVLGYIFEKYINQKQMGAYYTKEDITGYISRNTIIPFLFERAKKQCPIAFTPGGGVWRLLSDNPDRYFYEAVRHGITYDIRRDRALTAARELPPEIAAGVNDVSQRGGWNKPAPDKYALQTETWREHVARRQRYQEVRTKLAAGEVTSINDLITYNLDIEKFAQDVIAESEGPELVRAFWKALASVSILDPTCGSGAFLFAALNILEPMYTACLEAMQGFLDDLKRSHRKHHPEKMSDFRKVLEQVREHASERYFILKSIMVSNLFGVDIMEEAVEICKLRLFLKLVAQLDSYDQIEPLPDIDFNVRAGNTLVGFTSLKEIRKAFTIRVGGQGRMIYGEEEEELGRIEEDAEIADRAFRKFREMQTQQDMDASEFSDAKSELRKRLDGLRDELDCYLAGEYGIKTDNQTAYERWRDSHQPFHWFVEFFGIMRNGGFNVIIGNPPWREYSAVKKEYQVRAYDTGSCGNLYALCAERSIELASQRGWFSFIVQLPFLSSSRMGGLRKLLVNHASHFYYIPFDDRPGKLFDGLQHCRSVIFLTQVQVGGTSCSIYGTKYQRWFAKVRERLFHEIAFTSVRDTTSHRGIFPKLATESQVSLIHRLGDRATRPLSLHFRRMPTGEFVFYQEAMQYWAKATYGLPFYSKNGMEGAPPHGRYLYTDGSSRAHCIGAIINSSLFYVYFITYSDCFHLSNTLVRDFPMANSIIGDTRLIKLNQALLKNLHEKAIRKTIDTKIGDSITYEEFFAGGSKPIIDEIDSVLALHYGFTDQELDFIINYDVKYRMGREEVGSDA